jgi:derlin-1
MRPTNQPTIMGVALCHKEVGGLCFNMYISYSLIILFLQLLMDPMVLSVLYVWCQLNKDVIVRFWFGTQFKAMYLPWVLFAFNLVIAGG